jgi:hypothetical protein
MGATIGDGMSALALAGGIVGYLYLKYRARQHKNEIIHRERMAAMEKGIPLPEFPLETRPPRPQDQLVLPILGLILFSLSIGTMIVLFINPPAANPSFWIAPLPFAFMGAGLFAYHFTQANKWR